MDGKEKWNSGEPADRQGSEGSDAGQGFGATAAFGQVKPAAPSGADDDLLSLLMGGEKKPAVPVPTVAPEQTQGQASVPSGPVVHQVDSGSTGHFDVLSRMRAAEMPAPTPVAPSTSAPVPASTSAGAPQQPGGFTQMFQSFGSPEKSTPAQAASGQPTAGSATATFSTAPLSSPAPTSAPSSAPAPASSGGFTELFGKVSSPSTPPSREPVIPPAAASAPPVSQPVPQPASQPGSQPGSFTQMFSSFGGGPAGSPAPVPPAAPVPPTASAATFPTAPASPPPSAPPSGGFTSLFSTAAAAEPVKEKEPPISFGPESGTGAFKRSATASFSSFGGAAAASAPVPPAPAPAPSPTAFPVASSAAPSAPPSTSSGGFTELFTKLPAEERERGLSSTPRPDLNSPQPSLTQMFGTQPGASQQSAPPADPSSFTQILSRSSGSPMAPSNESWEPQRESGSGFSSRPEPSFATPAPAPQSDPSQNVGVTMLLRKLDSPSAPTSSGAPPMAAPAPSVGSEGSWTKTFETLSSPSSPAQSSPGGYGHAPSSGGEATRAMAMPQAPAQGSGFGTGSGSGSGSGYGAGYVSAAAPVQTPAAWQTTPAAPPPADSGPSEVTRIINASKMRENLLRSGEGQGQSGAAAAPQQAATTPGAAPGMPAIPGGVQFAGPQMNPQSLMHGGGGMSASASMGGMSVHGSAAPPAMGAGMGHMGGGAAGGMNMPHMQMPPMQAPAMNLKPPAAPAQTGAAAGPTKFQQMIPLLLVVIIFLLVALIVTVIFLMKH